jgi:hypothetical protein
VPLEGTVDEEGFVVPASAPCKTEALLRSVARGAVVEGVDDVDGGRGTKVIVEE